MKLEVGDKVVRGPDWRWGNQDGGNGNMGTVICHVKSNHRFVEIQWLHGVWTCYKYTETEQEIIPFTGTFEGKTYKEGKEVMSPTVWRDAPEDATRAIVSWFDSDGRMLVTAGSYIREVSKSADRILAETISKEYGFTLDSVVVKAILKALKESRKQEIK